MASRSYPPEMLPPLFRLGSTPVREIRDLMMIVVVGAKSVKTVKSVISLLLSIEHHFLSGPVFPKRAISPLFTDFTDQKSQLVDNNREITDFTVFTDRPPTTTISRWVRT